MPFGVTQVGRRNRVLDGGREEAILWVVQPMEKHWNVASTELTVASTLLPFDNNVEMGTIHRQ